MLDIRGIDVRPVSAPEERLYQDLMLQHHYLGALPKIGETIWYLAAWREQWVALSSFSAAALKCAARDNWVGWDFRLKYQRLKLVTNNSRFLILPQWHVPNLASRILSLCQKRISTDWQNKFGHPVLLLESFVDPQRFQGTIYKASNWIYVGDSKGFSRTRQGYCATANSPKMLFVKPLIPHVREALSRPVLDPKHQAGGSKKTLSAEHMRSLFDNFTSIPDPRRAQGRRHRIATVLAIAAGATLCGMRGYKDMAEWAQDLGKKARQRFRCRYCSVGKEYSVPSMSIIRDVLIRVDPSHLDEALQRWNEDHGQRDESLAIDGKTMCGAINEQGHKAHVMSVIGHQSSICYTQKKLATCL